MRQRALLTNFFVAGVSVFLAVTGVELLLRASRPFELGIWDVTREGLVVLIRDRCTHLPRMSQQICTNSLGMRDSDHALEKAEGTFRILVLGDSFMEALQVPLEDAFPRLLERRLNDVSNASIEVVSAGVSGWGTDDELTYLRLYGLRLRPDLLLIAMTLHNDVSDNLAMEWRRFEGARLFERALPLLSTRDYLKLRAKILLASHSHLYQAILRVWRSGEVETAAQSLDEHVAGLLVTAPPASIERGWSMTDALLEKFARTTEENRVRMAVFLIPLWIQVEPERLEAFLARHGLSRQSIIVEGPQQRVTSWGGRQGVPVIDLLPAFTSAYSQQASALYLEDDGHWSTLGHRLAAEEVGKQLVELGLVPRGASWSR